MIAMNKCTLPVLLLMLGSSPLIASDNSGLSHVAGQADSCLQTVLGHDHPNHHKASGHVADAKIFIKAGMTYSALDALKDAEIIIGHMHPHI